MRMMSRAECEVPGVAILSLGTFFRLQGQNRTLVVGPVEGHILHTDDIRLGPEKGRAHTSADPTSLRRSSENSVTFWPLWLNPTLSGFSQWKKTPSFRSKPSTRNFKGRDVAVGCLVSEDEFCDGKLGADKVSRSLPFNGFT